MGKRHFAYIDALRGYAILAVMAAHVSQLTPTWHGIGRKLIDQGARGVELFFLASALTLMMSWYARQERAIFFYIRRVFRIAPMFWLGILFYSLLHGLGPQYWAPNGVDTPAIIMTALFAHGWNPSFFNSVVPGGWSIAVEMCFYLVFPLLALYFQNLSKAFIGLLFSLLVAYFSFKYAFEYRYLLWPAVKHDYLSWNLINLWFPSEFPVFMTGIALYFLITKYPMKYLIINWGLLCISVATMVWLALREEPFRVMNGYLSIYAAYGMAFGIFAYALAMGSGAWVVNKPIELLGKISFSAYLWHFAVIEILGQPVMQLMREVLVLPESRGPFFLCLFTVIILVTACVASLTYMGIEKPMIRVGDHVIRYLKRQRSDP